MLVVNTTVVRALMVMRGLTQKSLAKLAGVREDNMRAWLSGSESADLCMARKNQILVLRALGVDEEAPRSDTVHAWYLDESSSRSTQEGLDALKVILSAYEDATVMHFGADEDSPFTLSQCSHFGLRFSSFRVVLTVKPGFFRDVKFSPDEIRGLAWADVDPVCFMPSFRFEQLSNADVTPTEFDDFAGGQVELAKWENLHLLAREHQIRAEDIALWMFREVSDREERLSIAHEQAKKHVLLEDANVIDAEPATAPVNLERRAAASPEVAKEARVEPAQPRPEASQAVIDDTAPTTMPTEVQLPKVASAPAAVAPVAPVILTPVEATAAAKFRAAPPVPRKAELTHINEHRMFVQRG